MYSLLIIERKVKANDDVMTAAAELNYRGVPIDITGVWEFVVD